MADYEVHKLTKQCRPDLGSTVWLWRADCERWVVERMTRSIELWLEHPNLAYTHWTVFTPPPHPPRPE
jgi:hypothetical protein